MGGGLRNTISKKLTMIDKVCFGFIFLFGFSLQTPGECRCPRGGVPSEVCASDGKTYWNSCLAECKNVTVSCQGECPCSTPSGTRIIDPAPTACKCPRGQRQVCGKDGNTYFNDCQARCGNADIQCYGGCPCRGPKDNAPNLFQDNNGISVSNLWNAFMAYIKFLQMQQG